MNEVEMIDRIYDWLYENPDATAYNEKYELILTVPEDQVPPFIVEYVKDYNEIQAETNRKIELWVKMGLNEW